MVDDTIGRPSSNVTLEQSKLAVQDFQVRRLKRDFRDLRRSEEYGPFADFFVTEIYSARDFTERNESFRRLAGQFRTVLGEEIYNGLVRLLDLHSLTDRLDVEIAESLRVAGTPIEFTEANYEVAYRTLDNYDDRVLQIDLIVESLQFTHQISRQALIGVVLKSARLAVGLFSKDRTIELLERACTMLRHIKNIDHLVREVRTREIARLDRIYS